jgi:hypothetical protein
MKALIDSMVIRLRRPIRTRARSPLPHIRQIVVLHAEHACRLVL